jgi:hypothetical protein
VTTYTYGDLVSLSRPQTSTVTVLSTPGGAGEDYSITVPINEQPRTFTYTADGTETLDEIASALEAVLLNEQTAYSIAIGSPAWVLAVVGRSGQDFDVSTTANLLPALAEEAVEGARERPVRVLDAQTVYTRTRDRVTVLQERILGRELETAVPFEFDADDVEEDLGPERFSE